VALKTGLEGKPWYFGLGVGLVLGLVVFGVGYYLLKPQREQYASLELNLQELQRKIQEGEAAQRQLPKFREEVRQLELELDKLLRILPARRNTPDLMRRIRSLAEQGDFALKLFKPGTLTDKEFFSEWPIAVNLEGTYHNLALFYDRISRFSRIINVEDLKINALVTSKGTHTIAATFTAKTFVYKEPAPVEEPVAPSPAAAAAGPAAGIRSGGAGGGPE